MFLSSGGPRFVASDRRPIYIESLGARLLIGAKLTRQKQRNCEKRLQFIETAILIFTKIALFSRTVRVFRTAVYVPEGQWHSLFRVVLNSCPENNTSVFYLRLTIRMCVFRNCNSYRKPASQVFRTSVRADWGNDTRSFCTVPISTPQKLHDSIVFLLFLSKLKNIYIYKYLASMKG
jgi:hypothetical protein